MRAISCVTFAGTTHASIAYSPVALIRSCSFLLAAVVPCALPSLIVMPHPPNQSTSPDKDRSIAGSTPLVSYAVGPWPVLNSHRAIWAFSKRLPPDAIVPSMMRSALLFTSNGSIWVAVIVSANAWMAACMSSPACAQPTFQQLWNSFLSRMTSRELAGSSRSIFGLTDSNATLTSASAK